MGDEPHPRNDAAQLRRGNIFDGVSNDDAQKKALEDAKYGGAPLLVFEYSFGGGVKLKYKTTLADNDATVWVKRKPGGGYIIGMGYGEEEYSSNDLTKGIRALIDGSGAGGTNFYAVLPPVDYIIDCGRLLTYEEYVFKHKHDPTRPGELLPPRLYRQVSERYWRTFQEQQKSDPEFREKFRELIRENVQQRKEMEQYRTWGVPDE